MAKNFPIFFVLLLCELSLKINARKLRPDFRSGTRFIRRPNIIFILVDDMDTVLGSPNVMKKTQTILRQEGADFVNAFVTTPMCCPSRTSILTGKYAHNHHTFTNNWNCSSPSWRRTHEKRTYARYLELGGYVTGYFGKYLNEYDGSWVPVGWKRWEGLLHNSKFYNYTLRHNTYKERHKMSYEHDYFTDLITNRSISFIQRVTATRPDTPFLAVLSHSAPHGPETPAPQYSKAFPDAKAPRFPNWNIVSKDKQWILREKQPMEAQQMAFVDLLHRRRLQTLLSVDDSVARIFSTVQSLGIENETYIFFTSDHGYHLGQFALVKGKSMPFESDIRVPFYVRGPSIPKNIRMKDMVLNIDLAPTFLDIAGVNIPKDMDGSSIMKLFRKSKHGRQFKRRMNVQWRDTFLIERSRGWRRTNKLLGGNARNKTDSGKDRKILTQTLEGMSRNRTLTKKERKMTLLEKICSKIKQQSPCQPKQLWECITLDGRPRLRKCRKNGAIQATTLPSTTRTTRSTAPTTRSTAPTTPVKMCVCMKPRPGHENQDDILPDDDRWLEDELDLSSAKELRRRSRRSRFFQSNRPRRNRDEFNARRYYKELARAQRKQNRRLKPKMLLRPPGTVTRTRLNNTEGQADRYDLAGVQEVVEEKLGKLKEKILETRIRLGALRDRRKKLLLISARDKLIEYPCPCDHGNNTREDSSTAASSLNGGGDGGDFGDDNDEESQISPIKRRNKQPKAVSRKVEPKRKKVKTSIRRSKCSSPGVNCFYQTNDHWKLPPLWTGGDFCFCPNSANNSYRCLRTINATHNFLYCEFITNFLEFFDLNQDPYQLFNVIHKVDPAVLAQLHQQLNKMISCQGADCNHYYDKKYTDVTITSDRVTTTPSQSVSASTIAATKKTMDGEFRTNGTKIETKSETTRPESGENENTTEGYQLPTETPRKRNKKPSGKRLNRNSRKRTKRPTQRPKTTPTSEAGVSEGEAASPVDGGGGYRNNQGPSSSDP